MSIVAASLLCFAGCYTIKAIPTLVTLPHLLENDRYKIQDKKLSPEALEKHMKSVDEQYSEPRTPASVALSLETARSYESSVNNYDALWRGARACAWLAQNTPGLAGREKFAILGISMGRAAIKEPALSNRVEPYYYLALAFGSYCDIEHAKGNIPASSLVKRTRDHADMAVALDPKYDFGGPHRFLGKLIVEPSDTLPPSVGSFEQGLDHLKKAVALYPGFAENRLFLAQALIEDEEHEAARAQIDKILDSQTPPDYSAEHDAWLKEAQSLIADLPRVGFEQSEVEVTTFDESKEEAKVEPSKFEKTEVDFDG